MHVLNRRRTDKQRKTSNEVFMSLGMIQRRSVAIRQKWSEGERLRRDGLVPEMPILKEQPKISQAERVRIHLRDGTTYGALKIAAGWRKLGEDREVIETAWAAFQNGDRDGEAVEAGLEALRVRLKVE
jgi:hypothetical protein